MSAPLVELPFDQYQRYGALELAASRLRARLRRPLRLLDVGDWNGLAARFCPEDWAVCLDPDGRGVGRYVQADGRWLPFADRAFDVVVCLDMLEHVPPPERPRIAAELRRVARHAVVLAVPIADHGAAALEQALYDYVRTVLGGEQVQLREHRENGLPRADEVRGWLSAPGWRCADTPSGLLEDWLTMMLAKHLLLGVGGSEEAHRALDRRYNERHGAIDPASPAYRQVYFAAPEGEADLIEELTAALPARRSTPDPHDVAGALRLLVGAHAARAGAPVELAGLLGPEAGQLAAASGALDARVQRLRDELSGARAELETARAERDGARERVRAYEAGRFMRAMAGLAGLRRTLLGR